jgi:glycerophosphoryl diester phosphodiesterase
VFFGSLTALQIPRSSGPLRFDSAGFIRAVQQAGLEVHYWTINSPDEMNELLDLGANGLVTDRCDLAVNIRQNRL